MQFRKYTKEQFIEAVATSYSIAEVLKKIGIVPHGGNYRVANGYIKKLGLDISHFTGQGHLKNKTHDYTRKPLSDYLDNIRPIQSNILKKRLIADKVFEPVCSCCHLSEWLNKPIPLELDHIDGNHKNNNLINLRLLCPNCHAKTSNYRGKNQSRRIKNEKTLLTMFFVYKNIEKIL